MKENQQLWGENREIVKLLSGILKPWCKLVLWRKSCKSHILLSQWIDELRENVCLYYRLSQVVIIVSKPSKSQCCCLLDSWDRVQQERPQKGHHTCDREMTFVNGGDKECTMASRSKRVQGALFLYIRPIQNKQTYKETGSKENFVWIYITTWYPDISSLCTSCKSVCTIKDFCRLVMRASDCERITVLYQRQYNLILLSIVHHDGFIRCLQAYLHFGEFRHFAALLRVRQLFAQIVSWPSGTAQTLKGTKKWHCFKWFIVHWW